MGYDDIGLQQLKGDGGAGQAAGIGGTSSQCVYSAGGGGAVGRYTTSAWEGEKLLTRERFQIPSRTTCPPEEEAYLSQDTKPSIENVDNFKTEQEMSARPLEMAGPVSHPGTSAVANEANEDGIDPAPAKSDSVNIVSVTHGLILSGIELALTVGNALYENAFELNSFSDLIFAGSVVLEAVGFAFAIGTALRVLLYPVKQGVIGVGVPAMVLAEALFMKKGPGREDSALFEVGLQGLAAQAVCFVVFAVTAWSTSPASLPTVSITMWVLLALACAAFLYVGYKRHRAVEDTLHMLYAVGIALPFVVEVSESALLFESDSTSFVAYLLAVLDLVIIAPAAFTVFLLTIFFVVDFFN